MAIAISNWGSSSLDWLQHGVCSGSCNEQTTLSVFSNIKIHTNGMVPEDKRIVIVQDTVWTPESIDDYAWGNDCTGMNDQLCQQFDCAECKWSWPLSMTWEHTDAACRCKAVYNDWNWDSECPSSTSGFCSEVLCNRCLAAWPKDS